MTALFYVLAITGCFALACLFDTLLRLYDGWRTDKRLRDALERHGNPAKAFVDRFTRAIEEERRG